MRVLYPMILILLYCTMITLHAMEQAQEHQAEHVLAGEADQKMQSGSVLPEDPQERALLLEVQQLVKQAMSDALANQEKTGEQIDREQLEQPLVKALMAKIGEHKKDESSSLLGKLFNAGNAAYSFIKAHPVLSTVAASALIGIPILYAISRPTFAYTASDYSDFYKRILSADQRERYKTQFFLARNPLELVEDHTFTSSLSLDQKMYLLALVRSFIASDAFHEKNGEIVSQEEGVIQAAHVIADAFEQEIRDQLRLKPISSYMLEGFNRLYETHSTPVRYVQAFSIEGSPKVVCCHSRSNRVAASFLKHKTINIWDIRDGSCLAVINTHFSQEISLLTFDSTGHKIAAISTSGEIFVIDTDTQEVSSWKYDTDGAVSSICFNKTCNWLALGTQAGNAKIFEIQSNKVIDQRRLGSRLRVSQLLFCDDVLIGLVQQVAYALPIRKKEEKRANSIDPVVIANDVLWIASDDDSKYCYTIEKSERKLNESRLNELKLYDCTNKYQLKETIPLNVPTDVACCSFDGSHIAYRTSSGSIEVWDVHRKQMICSFSSFSSQQICCLDFGSTYRELLGATLTHERGMFKLWQLDESALPVNNFDNNNPEVTAAPFAPWVEKFIELAEEIAKENGSDSAMQWDEFDKIDLDDPHNFIDCKPFMNMLSQHHKEKFLEILLAFCTDSLLSQLDALLEDNQKEFLKLAEDDFNTFLILVDKGEIFNEQQLGRWKEILAYIESFHSKQNQLIEAKS